MYSGRIQGLGPRYCPSIEDKITRFSERDRHQLFVEPEGWDTVEIYVNGFSTSLPVDVQQKALKLIPGFENAKMFRPGYAIEYDFFPPDQLLPTLETKDLPYLYFAGQINGTTGYEEAACQGLIAGINAAIKVKEKDPLVLQRDQAYIGVLIDDLITKSTDEPYRMFTSRAEYRTLLRQDNADERLTPLSHAIGLATDERMSLLENKRSAVQTLTKFMDKTSVTPEEINPYLTQAGSTPIDQKVKLMSLLTRPQVSLEGLISKISSLEAQFSNFDTQLEDLVAAIEINAKYAGYLKKEKDMADKIARLDHIQLSPEFNYNQLTSLSFEARQKLTKIRPATVGQASRISGVNPSDIAVLLVFLGR
jgi:tRNA uridine 5-carboxymethylaminomethyl modification enzyme